MINNLQKLNQLNQLLSGGQATQVGPMDIQQPTELINPIPNQGLLGNLKQRGQTFITRLGGISPADQAMATQAQLDEARFRGRKELASRLSDALLGKDIGAGAARRQQLFQEQEEERQAKLQEEQLQQKLKGYYENLPEGSLKNFAKLMLDAPGGYKNLPAVFNLQYQQEQKKQEEDQYSASIDSAMREGLIDQTYGNQLKELPMELGYKLYSQSIFGGAEEKTANQRDLAAWNQAKADFDAGKISQEEFDAATEILGAGAGIPKEQQIVNLASKLYAAKDSVGEPMYEENEIQERLKQFANTYDAYFAIDLGPQD